MADKPWENESDRRDFESFGLPCIVLRSRECGHLCGYVGVPRSHPLFGKDYGSVDLDVHGGLTFSVPAEHMDLTACWDQLASDAAWWFGFDCGHLGDLSPRLVEKLKKLGSSVAYMERDSTYRDMAYVEAECRLLANQLAAMGEVSWWRRVWRFITKGGG